MVTKRADLIEKISKVHEDAANEGISNESFAYLLLGLGLGIIDSEFGRKDTIKRMDKMRSKLLASAPSIH